MRYHQNEPRLDEQNTPEHFIFFGYFQISVQEKYFLTEEQDMHVGIRITGDKKFDKQWGNQWRRMPATIVQMAEWMDLGATIQLADLHDAPKIAGWIKEHITNWTCAADLDPNISHPPLDDFRKLEQVQVAMERSACGIIEVSTRYVTGLEKLFQKFGYNNYLTPMTAAIPRSIGTPREYAPIMINGKPFVPAVKT